MYNKVQSFMILIIALLYLTCQSTTAKEKVSYTHDDIPADSTVHTAALQDSVAPFGMDYIMGKFDPATHPDFIEIPHKYRDSTIRFLRKDVLLAFIAMADEAQKAGVSLTIISSTRNFDKQKEIWEKKWTGKTILEDGTAANTIKDPVVRALKILKYSSMPGTSRHHWGTDIDINNLTNSYFDTGKGKKEYAWLKANASKHGFCQVYSVKGSLRNSGYNEERWHWSYTPISNLLTMQVEKEFSNAMIACFAGSETATNIDMKTKYMLGISMECR